MKNDMKKRYKNKYQEIIGSFNIEKAGGEGKAIGYHDGKVVFVKVAAPGDVADIKITAVKRRFFEAEIVNFI
jgi:tRNA/tmRNA/rRNA uracil-C5-methylase (TrmA/RlmC/RlmD family)